jgi:hypothetical protein
LYVARRLADAKANKTPMHRVTTNWGGKGSDLHYAYDGLRKVTNKPCNGTVDAIYIDGNDIGKVIAICLDGGCKTHGGGGSSRRSSQSSSSEPKAKEQRKALLAKVKIEKDYRLLLFRELMAKRIDATPTDAMVQALVVFAMGRFDSTKHDTIAEILGWPKEYFGWQHKEKGALARLSEMSQAEALRVALVGLEANELTVHEHDVDCKTNSGKKPEIGLERVARLIGVDAAAIRERVDPSAKKPAKTPAKKPAAKPPAKKVAKVLPTKAARKSVKVNTSKSAKKAATKSAVKKAAKKGGAK